MLDLALLFISAVATFVLTILGAVVTTEPDWATKHKKPIVLSFASVGGILFMASIWQGLRAVQSSANASSALDRLGTAITEQTRLSTLNSELQRVSLELSRENRELSSETLRSVLGGRQ